jgi:hypothetical protein
VDGYLIHHQSEQCLGIRADRYRNDPYVWHSPYLWSFCHAGQVRVERGMTVLWLTKANGHYVCDLVFVVGEILQLEEAFYRFVPGDTDLGWYHFLQGIRARHKTTKTYVADMQRSYIPQPAVCIEDAVDELRRRERLNPKPLQEAWRRPAAPLRIEAIDKLEKIVGTGAKRRLRCAVDTRWHSPGQWGCHPPCAKRIAA